jgi:hypothetical protein
VYIDEIILHQSFCWRGGGGAGAWWVLKVGRGGRRKLYVRSPRLSGDNLEIETKLWSFAETRMTG